jgi:hypothetical protein
MKFGVAQAIGRGYGFVNKRSMIDIFNTTAGLYTAGNCHV